MSGHTSYAFYFIRIRDTYALLTTLFAGFVVVVPVAFMLEHYHVAPRFSAILLIVLAILWLGGTGYFAAKLIRARNKREEITFLEDGFISKIFGQIYFDDIDHYEIRKGLSRLNFDKPAPSLLVFTKAGKTYRFDLHVKQYEQEIPVYMAFLDTFVSRVEAWQKRGSDSWAEGVSPMGDVPIPKDEHDQRATPAPAVRNKAATAHVHTEAKDALEAARERQNRARNIVIPVSLVISLFIIVRNCAPDIVRRLKPDPLANLHQNTSAQYREQQNALQRTIANEGAVYLYTNDSLGDVKPVLIPNAGVSLPTGFPVLDMSEDSRTIRDFIRDKDSLGYSMYLWRDSLQFPQIQYHLRANTPESKKLYFFLYDEQAVLSSYFRVGMRGEKPRAPFNLMWMLAYDDLEELPEKMANSTGYTNLTDLTWFLERFPDVRFYVASSQFHGHTRQDFARATQIIQSTLREKGVDTGGFAIRHFETGLVNHQDSKW